MLTDDRIAWLYLCRDDGIRGRYLRRRGAVACQAYCQLARLPLPRAGRTEWLCWPFWSFVTKVCVLDTPLEERGTLAFTVYVEHWVIRNRSVLHAKLPLLFLELSPPFQIVLAHVLSLAIVYRYCNNV